MVVDRLEHAPTFLYFEFIICLAFAKISLEDIEISKMLTVGQKIKANRCSLGTLICMDIFLLKY